MEDMIAVLNDVFLKGRAGPQPLPLPLAARSKREVLRGAARKEQECPWWCLSFSTSIPSMQGTQ